MVCRIFRYFFISIVFITAIYCSSMFGFSYASQYKKSDFSDVVGLIHSSSKVKPFSLPLSFNRKEAVGSLPGRLNITPMGSASYSIPITVSPGTAEMTPSLSIKYDSSHKNGLLGMGFSLQGLSSISRTNQTKAQNGVSHEVDFTDRDRFSFNGEQLVAIKGKYGGDQTEYRTYHDSFSKVVSVGRQGNSPQKFKVWTKGGQVAEYGYTLDSRVKAEGKETIAVWALNKIKDTSGNYLQVQYRNDFKEGAFYPVEINYTGNDCAHLLPYNKVKFIYQDREDKITRYRSGSKATISQLLSAIEVYHQNELVYRYKLTYELSSNTGRSRLIQVQQCAKSGVCLPPTLFRWQKEKKNEWYLDNNYRLPVPTARLIGGRTYFPAGVDFVDLNGNGLLDIVQHTADGESGAWINTGVKWKREDRYRPPIKLVRDAYGRDNGVRFVDLNHNGLVDIIHYSESGEKGAWLNTKEGWQAVPRFIPPVPFVTSSGDDNGVRFIDVDGDGQKELVQAIAGKKRQIWKKSALGWEKKGEWEWPVDITTFDHKDNGVRLVDLNGNGLIDIIQHNGLGVKGAWINTGKGWKETPEFIPPVPFVKHDGKGSGVRLVDLHGDGLVGIVQHSKSGEKGAWINTGYGWKREDSFIPPVELSHENGVQLLDLNGNGLLDIVQSKRERSDIISKAWVNRGGAWRERPLSIGFPFFVDQNHHIESGLKRVDCNGSGRIGLLNYPDHRSQEVWLRERVQPDLLTEIVNGLGAHTKISYKPLTDTDLYAKENKSRFPSFDVQAPIYIVSETKGNTDNNDPTLGSNENAEHITRYRYTGAVMDLSGWGFLGFRQVEVRDQTTGLSTVTTYSQNAAGHLLQKPLLKNTYRSDGRLIHSKEMRWKVKSAKGVYFSYNNQMTERFYTLNGKLKGTKEVEIELDNYGNSIRVVESLKDKMGDYNTITNNIYRNNLARWYLGELIKTEVVASTNHTEAIKRESEFHYDQETGLLSRVIVEPNDEQYRLIKVMKRDRFGHIIQTTLLGKGIESRVSNVQYDQLGRFEVSKRNALNQIQRQEVDGRSGKVIKMVDENQLTTQYEYDDFGRLVQAIIPDGKRMTQSLKWYNHFHSLNHLSCSSRSFSRDPLHYAVYFEVKDTEGSMTTVIYYDKLNREVARTSQGLNGQVIWQTTQYDDLGRAVRQSLPYFQGEKPLYASMEYDVLGRMIKTTKANGSVVAIEYDHSFMSPGSSSITINPLNQKTVRSMNIRGDLIEALDAQGHSIRYRYDPFGNMTRMIDSVGNVTLLRYDRLGHKIEERDPNKGCWYYRYNVLGELISETNAKGQATAFRYDQLGRVIARVDQVGISRWEYDAAVHGIGKLSKVESVSSLSKKSVGFKEKWRAEKEGLSQVVEEYRYDILSRPIEKIYAVGHQAYKTSTTYDRYSRPFEITYPSGLRIRKYYNELGYLVLIKPVTGNTIFWQANKMDARGNFTHVSHGNGLSTRSIYDAATGFITHIQTISNDSLFLQNRMFSGLLQEGRKKEESEPIASVTSESHLMNKRGEVQSLRYYYDALGKVVRRRNEVTNREEEFKYDNLNRLIRSSNSKEKARFYSYDQMGNLLSQSGVGHYTYGENGAGPHAVTKVQGEHDAVFKYDRNGNQTDAMIDGVKRTIDYTRFDKPKKIQTSDQSVSFYYDANRERFKRIDRTKEEMISTLYLDDYVIEQHNRNNRSTIEEKHYIGPNTLYVKGSDGVERVYYLLKDNLGSITVITDEMGKVVQHFHYSAFGNQEKENSEERDEGKRREGFITRRGFTGHEQITGVNLIHMSGRLYDPIICRFLSADPLIQAPDNTQSLNRYSYCVNDPLTLTDPTGYGWLGDLVEDMGEIFHAIGHAIDEVLRDEHLAPFLQVAVGVLACTVGAPVGGIAWMPALFNAAVTNAAGGNTRDIVRSAFITEVSVLSWGMTGSALNHATLGERILANGVVGGALSGIEGRGFSNGFLSAAVFEVTSIPGRSQNNMMSVAERTLSTSLVGGTVAAVTGGNFISGMKTAAFSELFNRELNHYWARKQAWAQENEYRYSNSDELRRDLGKNGIVFSERSLFSRRGVTYRSLLTHALHVDLAHEQIFYTNSFGVLHSVGYFKNKGVVDVEVDYMDLKHYQFGPVHRPSNLSNDALHPSGFGSEDYILFGRNCQVYADRVRRSLNIGMDIWFI